MTTTRQNLPKKIAVLMGGPGSERDVSMATGKGVAKALRSLGADVIEVDVKGADFQLPDEIELAFIALHGTFGEDGQVQQILEDRGIPYTGEGVAESELAFNKIRSKEAFSEHDVTTPYWQIITAGQRPTIPIPFVIKAPRQGSTVGVHIIRNERDVEDVPEQLRREMRFVFVDEAEDVLRHALTPSTDDARPADLPSATA